MKNIFRVTILVTILVTFLSLFMVSCRSLPSKRSNTIQSFAKIDINGPEQVKDTYIIVDGNGEFHFTDDNGNTFNNVTSIIKIICKTGEIGVGGGSANIEIFGMKLTLMWRPVLSIDEVGDFYPTPIPENSYTYNGVNWNLFNGHLSDC